ncbi:biotin transporter BioY [bacterium]|nr:biotin transporter BioY [bacterium]
MLKLLRTALFASLTALGTYVAVPLPYVVFGEVHLPNAMTAWSFGALSTGLYTTSAQAMALGAAGTFLSPVGAFVAQAAYLILGLAGVPVFADGGGLTYLQSPSFPFLITFPFAAWLIARLAPHGGSVRRWKALMAGQLLVLGVGTLFEILGAGHLGVPAAWGAHAWPASQTLLGMMLAMVPFALLGGIGDFFTALFTPSQPATPPVRESLPAPAPVPERIPSMPIPPQRQLPGPPERIKLGEAPQRQKAIEGPPPRVSLPKQPPEA